jgi:D-tagatose-1,6-bisphosphate aldolase subunit GatZ/KbaZ
MFPRETVDASPIRKKAQKAGIPVCDFLMQKMQELAELEGKPQTLLAVCPNSRTVIRAALRAAKRARAPVKFAATLNQVDIDRGYTGLTQREFVELVKQEAEAIHFEGLVIIALDHGGPWVKDRHTIEGWDLKTCMDWVKRSFEAALDAGYDLLHVDPTVDRTLPPGTTLPVETVIARTVELIEHAENHRKKRGLPPISYEVGTEEVHGGLADLGVFERFLSGLKDALKAQGTWGSLADFRGGESGNRPPHHTFRPPGCPGAFRKGSIVWVLHQGTLHRLRGEPRGLSEIGHGGGQRGPGVHRRGVQRPG